ncbi:MAG: hypothetical protein ACRCSF_06930 [Mycobacteriaceae bacterium]
MSMTIGALALLLMTGCSSVATAPPEAARAIPQGTEASAPAITPQQFAFKESLIFAGLPLTSPDSMLFALAQGICTQLSAKTPEADILANLKSVAAYTATQTDGRLNETQVAQIYLENSKSKYC